MTTRFVFTPESATLPSSNMPGPGVDGQGRPYLAFDATTQEACDWGFVAPEGLTTPLAAVITYRMASATSGEVRFEAFLEAISDGDSVDTDSASSFSTTNSAGATVPGTAGHIDQITITLANNDGIVAGDYCRLRFDRDSDQTTGTDDATGDAQVLMVELRDAA